MKPPKCQPQFCIHHCSAISKSQHESIWPWPRKLTDCGHPSSDAKLSELGFGFGYLKGYKSDLLSLSWSSVHLRGVYPLFERGLDTGLARRTLLCHHHSCSVYSSDGSRHLRCLQTYRHKNLFLEALRDSSKWIAIKPEVKLKPEINRLWIKSWYKHYFV